MLQSIGLSEGVDEREVRYEAEEGAMTTCAACHRDLTAGEAFDLVRIQQWRTKVGSAECKGPDSDDTRSYCIPCARRAPVTLMKE